MIIALASNYSALGYWFLFHPQANRDMRRLQPTLDPLPPLIVGGLISAALILHQQYPLLFGVWMCCYGLTNLSSHRVLPRTIWLLGGFYIICGAGCLLAPNISFTNPWPMGIVFFLGELAGGLIFHHNRRPETPISRALARWG